MAAVPTFPPTVLGAKDYTDQGGGIAKYVQSGPQFEIADPASVLWVQEEKRRDDQRVCIVAADLATQDLMEAIEKGLVPVIVDGFPKLFKGLGAAKQVKQWLHNADMTGKRTVRVDQNTQMPMKNEDGTDMMRNPALKILLMTEEGRGSATDVRVVEPPKEPGGKRYRRYGSDLDVHKGGTLVGHFQVHKVRVVPKEKIIQVTLEMVSMLYFPAENSGGRQKHLTFSKFGDIEDAPPPSPPTSATSPTQGKKRQRDDGDGANGHGANGHGANGHGGQAKRAKQAADNNDDA